MTVARTRISIMLGLALIAGAAGVLYPVFVAKSLIRDLRTIEGQSISEAWLRQWAESRGGYFECDDSDCEAGVEVYNWPLSKLRLAWLAMFIATVILKEGRLSGVQLILSDLDHDAHPQGATTFAYVDYTEVDYSGADPTIPVLRSENQGTAPHVSYTVHPAAGPDAVALAYTAINVWCLARIGRCANSEQAPELWAQRKSN